MSIPVSLPIAKLLKEKGWDKPVDSRWFYDTEYFEYKLSIKGATKWTPGEESSYPAPTVDEVKWWLYKKHQLWIYPWVIGIDSFCYTITKIHVEEPNKGLINNVKDSAYSDEKFDSPEEAYKAAIEYTLENLL